MKADTPLDYAVFQLNEAQSRCELWICAGDKNEKLASGSFKPFLVHLRVAKEQIAKGASFIILQAPPFVGDGSPWFTKRTVERFVRFVSTPDVLEGVGILEAELGKLDDATQILISDSTWTSTPVTPRTGATGAPSYKSEADKTGEQAKVYARRASFDYAGVALLDGSKRDLLKAMDTRKMMLLHEQKKAFAHATSAGFNVACISDLMVFANCFGAPRLWEACLKFLTLCKKRQDTHPEEVHLEASSTSSDSSIQILSTISESSEEGLGGSSGSSKTKSRKTWDPQVMSTLQQLYSRKVENGAFMSPDAKQRKQKTEEQNRLGDEDLVMGVRESVCNPHIVFEEELRTKVEHKTISVQDAINLFESKQQKPADVPKKKTLKDAFESENVAEKAVNEEVPKTKAEQTMPENFTTRKPSAETEQKIDKIQQLVQKVNALAVVSEASELEDLDSIEWKPLSKSSGYVFDDMFLEQKNTGVPNTRRQSLCVWKTNWDSDSEQLENKRGLKGRFYEQYQEIREAKLKHEPVIKKAEKEAKLRAMQDVLERRKAELSTRSMRLPDKSSSSSSTSRNNSNRKDMESKSSELSKAPSKRTSPVTSVHSAPSAANRTLSLRRPSPSSHKSSTTTTPRATASVDSKAQGMNRTQRRSAESLYPEQGKENVDPLYTSDLDAPQPFKFLERKSKPVLLPTKKNDQHGKGMKQENVLQKKGKQSPQSRQLSAASSAVRAPVPSESSKVQKTKSDLSTSSVSSDILLPLKLDNEDAESSCSCPNADVEVCGELRDENAEDGNEKAEQKGGSWGARVECENTGHEKVGQAKDEKVECGDVGDKMDTNEKVGDLSGEGDEKNVMEDETQTSDHDEKQVVSKDETAEQGVCNTTVEEQVDSAGDEIHTKTQETVGQHTEQRAEEQVDLGLKDAEQQGDPKDEVENTGIEATIDMDELIEELERDELRMEPTLSKSAPLFELAELDQKQFPAAYKVLPPLEEFSSSTGGTSEDTWSCSKTKSSGSSKSDTENGWTNTAGSFIPRSVAEAQQVHTEAAASLSEPGSPSKLPLFDLLVTEQSTKNSSTCNQVTTANSNSNSKNLKSSSHKLPHMCRVASPDGRGAESSNKKLLLKSSASASASQLTETSSKPAKEPLKGFRRFLRFGRRSCGASSSATSDRIMWQNGWFKGE